MSKIVDELMVTAELLHIDPLREPHLLWIAEEALEFNDEQYTNIFKQNHEANLFYNTATKQISHNHPILELFRQIVQRCRNTSDPSSIVSNLTNSNVSNRPQSRPTSNRTRNKSTSITSSSTTNILSDITNRISSINIKNKTKTTTTTVHSDVGYGADLSVRLSGKSSTTMLTSSALTPELLKRVCLEIFNFDIAESHLTVYCGRIVLSTLNDWMRLNVELSNVDAILSDIMPIITCVLNNGGPYEENKEGVNQSASLFKVNEIILCSECESRSAILKCTGSCLDYFCLNCFNSTHSTGKRKHHPVEDVEQLVCSVCDLRVACCHCENCALFFCDACFISFHVSSNFDNHVRHIISAVICLNCQLSRANIICENCVDMFCTDCFVSSHSKKRSNDEIVNINHTYASIDSDSIVTLSNGKKLSLADSEVCLEACRSTFPSLSSYWIEFIDNGSVYWYNFSTSEKSTTSPILAAYFEAVGRSSGQGTGPSGHVGEPIDYDKLKDVITFDVDD